MFLNKKFISLVIFGLFLVSTSAFAEKYIVFRTEYHMLYHSDDEKITVYATRGDKQIEFLQSSGPIDGLEEGDLLAWAAAVRDPRKVHIEKTDFIVEVKSWPFWVNRDIWTVELIMKYGIPESRMRPY